MICQNPMMNPTMVQMNPMMMNPMMCQNPMMNPMMVQMNPMMMNPMIGQNPMMNPMMCPIDQMGQNMGTGNNNTWNLFFEDKWNKKTTYIFISPEKNVSEAINLYKIKSGTMDDKTAKFIYNGKNLILDIKISQSGLQNNSIITTISTKNVLGSFNN